MVTIVTVGSAPPRMDQIAGRDFSGVTIAEESATSATITVGNGEQYRFTGTDFQFNAHGVPIGGTITGFEDVTGGVVQSEWTGLSLDGAQLGQAIHANDIADFIAAALAGDDSIAGGAGADVLAGYDGNDILSGGAGDDVITGGNGNDTIGGGPGADTISGGPGADTISGNGGADILNGNGGADVIIGGAGADTLTGGAGADSFVYKLASDSPVSGPDLITDFVHGQDKIDLTALHLALAGDVTIATSGGMTSVLIDTANDGTADMRINLTGAHALTTNDILGIPAAAAEHVDQDHLAAHHALTVDHGLYG